MRVTCDTNVLVRAAISPTDAAAELLSRIVTVHVVVASQFEFAELFDVLRRPRIRALHCLDDRRIRRFISRLYQLSAIVPLPAEIPSIVPHDPKDNPIVTTAVAGQADVLCTLDRHLHEPIVRASAPVTASASRGTPNC